MNYRSLGLYRWLRIPVKEFIMMIDRMRNRRSGILEAPPITEMSIKTIEKELMSDQDINDHIVNIEIDKSEYNNLEIELGFQKHYDKKFSPRYEPKILEYLLAKNILDFESHKNDSKYLYVDAASANSPWVIWLREQYGITAYSLDLLPPPKQNSEYYIKGDVTNMPFKDSSVDAISMQSALETFPQSVDIDFIKEAGRVLRENGSLLITPLYLSTEYCNCFGKKYFAELIPDEGARKYIRLGYNGPTTRLYDVKHLKSRIWKTAQEVGLEPSLLIFDMDTLMVDRWDNYMYSHFGLLLKK